MPKCETLQTEKMGQVKKVIMVCMFNIKRHLEHMHGVVVCYDNNACTTFNMHYHYDVYG